MRAKTQMNIRKDNNPKKPTKLESKWLKYWAEKSKINFDKDNF